jgi:hypothetical protein
MPPKPNRHQVPTGLGEVCDDISVCPCHGGGPTELDRKLGAVSGTLLGSRYAAFC